ncbi:unnamed protein product [Pleuronectes platessa]|uniref:Secreted protein n=1 Tax=Pleuronectes platessa TaxID=8262 RepID=A0A9N7URJ2_PLEPL|nr:unnamed protein product [Pleuronectes platessa]
MTTLFSVLLSTVLLLPPTAPRRDSLHKVAEHGGERLDIKRGSWPKYISHMTNATRLSRCCAVAGKSILMLPEEQS